jgi:hypothetical protein
MVIRSACERDIVLATEQQQRRAQSLRSELVQIQHQLRDQQVSDIDIITVHFIKE